MKKKIVLIGKGNQFGVEVEESKAEEVVQSILEKLSDPDENAKFMCITNCIDAEERKTEIWVRLSDILAVVVEDRGNIAVPNKKSLFVPKIGQT